MIQRSLRVKAAEAILKIYEMDVDVVRYWRRLRFGPLDTLTTGPGVSITPPQLHVMPAPRAAFAPGVSGAAHTDVSILVLDFEPYMEAVREEFGVIRPECRLEHLQILISRGSIDPETGTYGKSGRLINPDNPTAVTPTEKYLSVYAPSFQEFAPARTDDGIAMYGFEVTFGTRQDNDTRARV